jgi:ribosomal protein S18
MEAERTITRPVTPPSTAEREPEEYMKINNYSKEKMKSIEINREKHLRKYKQSNEELEALKQRKKARQAQGVNPMDWTDPVALRKYINDLVSGKHRMKGRALTSKSIDKWPGLKAVVAAMAEEEEQSRTRPVHAG